METVTKAYINEICYDAVGCCIRVHNFLGPGLLESAYESCLCHELSLRGLAFKRQVPVAIDYKGLRVESAFRIDVFVDDLVIVELKAVDELASIHEAQLLTYQRFTDCWLGLLINFNVKILKDGIKRLVM